MMRRFPSKGTASKVPDHGRREIFLRLRNIAKAALGHYDHLDTANPSQKGSAGTPAPKPVQEPPKGYAPHPTPRVPLDPYTPPWLPPRTDQASRQDTVAKPLHGSPSQLSPTLDVVFSGPTAPESARVPDQPPSPALPNSSGAPNGQTGTPSGPTPTAAKPVGAAPPPKPKPEPPATSVSEGTEEINDALAEAERAELEALQREYSAAFAASEKPPSSPLPTISVKSPITTPSPAIEVDQKTKTSSSSSCVGTDSHPEPIQQVPSQDANAGLKNVSPEPQSAPIQSNSEPIKPTEVPAPVETIPDDVQQLLALQEEFLRLQETEPELKQQPTPVTAASPAVPQSQSLPKTAEVMSSLKTNQAPPQVPTPTAASPAPNQSRPPQPPGQTKPQFVGKGNYPRPNQYGQPKTMVRVKKGPSPFVYPTGLGIAEARQWHAQYTAVLPQVKDPNPLKTDADQNVHLVSTIDEAESAAQIIEAYCKESCFLGIDLEWAVGKQASLLQVATAGDVFLFRLRQVDPESPEVLEMPLPDRLQDIIADPNIFKCTVSIDEDRKRLKAQTGVELHGGIDLYHLFLHIGYPLGQQTGLKALTAHVCGAALDKDRRVRCSNWEKSDLSVEQIDYAVNDVRASFGVFEAVVKAFQLHTRDEIVSFMRPVVDVQLRSDPSPTTAISPPGVEGSPKPNIIVPRRSIALAQLFTRNALLRMVDMIDRHCPQLAHRLPELWDRYQKTAKKLDIFKQLKEKVLPPGVEEYHILPKVLDGVDSESSNPEITWGEEKAPPSKPTKEKETPVVKPQHEFSPPPNPSQTKQDKAPQPTPAPNRIVEATQVHQTANQSQEQPAPTATPPPSSEELFVPPDIEELLAAQEAYHKEQQAAEPPKLPSKVPLKDSPPLPPTVRRRKRNPATLPEFISQPMSTPISGSPYQAEAPKPVLQTIFHHGAPSSGQGTVETVVQKQLREIQSQLESLKRTGHPEFHQNRSAHSGPAQTPTHPIPQNGSGVKQVMSKLAVDRQLFEVMEATRKHPQVARSGQQSNSFATSAQVMTPAGGSYLSHRGVSSVTDKHKKSNEGSPDAEVNAWCEDLIRQM